MCSIGCKLMQLEISKTGISMVSSSSGSVSTFHMSSGAHPLLPLEDQEVSCVPVLEDYKESVVRDSLDHMDKEQVEKFKSHLEKEHIEKLKSDMEKEDIEKFNKYEIEGRKYLISKYFSDKTIFGGNIFDVKMTKDGETTKVSRFPGYQSYADPANFNDGSSSVPVPNSTSGTPSNLRKRKHSSMKE